MSRLFSVPSIYTRDVFLDVIKGFAIFLMVIGHVITWLYDPSLTQSPFRTHIWWNVIYSFHMSLLFFVSGYLFPKGNGLDLQSACKRIKKRVVTLLVPFVIGGWLYHLFRGLEWTVLWFLLSLFCFSLINTIWEIVRNKGKYNMLLDSVYYIALFVIMAFIMPKRITEVMGLKPVQYLFFSLGILIKRNGYERLLENKHIFSISFLIFVLANYLFLVDIKIPQYAIITSASGIIT